MYLYSKPYEAHIRAPIGFGEDASDRSQIDQEIGAAKQRMQAHAARYDKLSAGAGRTNDGTAARKEVGGYWEWAGELAFLLGLRQVYESQAGVPLNYRHYPITKSDSVTGKITKNSLWRKSATRQLFDPSEANGSFCLGAARGMAFRSVFGLDRPSYRQVLTDLKKGIESAKTSNDVDSEAQLLISRIVSHRHDPGSLKQFNQDLPSRYTIKNVLLRSASRDEAFAALKLGAPVLADLQGGWHWVLVQRSPRGVLWANDPLSLEGKIYKIPPEKLGSRFEMIVDATTNDPITPGKAGAYK